MTWSEYSFMLKPSNINGIGVFATHDIPQGCSLFCTPYEIRIAKIAEIPPALLPYCIYINEREAKCPERFDRMEIGWYINHSFLPNISQRGDDIIYTLRDIKAGEEIFLNYNELNEPENMKEEYYRRTNSSKNLHHEK